VDVVTLTNGGVLRDGAVGGAASLAISTTGAGVQLADNLGCFEVDDAGATLSIAGMVGGVGSLTKTGAGVLNLLANNTYTGPTTVSNGTLLVSGSIGAGSAPVTVVSGALGGTGTILAPVDIQPGASLAPGSVIGTLTINNTLTLEAGSTTLMAIDAASNTSDLVQGLSSITYGGALVVTNVADTPFSGSFKLFDAAGSSGNFTSVTIVPAPSGGTTWSFSPATGVLTVAGGVSTTRTPLLSTVTGSTLSLSWPSDHIGWRLQAQTNTVGKGLSANWVTVPNSTTVNSMSFPIDKNGGSVFYRLVYP
jgi:autotransporter-associated beta strand protein